MPENNDDGKTGWKPGSGTYALVVVGALVLSALTCWAFRLNPLPTSGHAMDTGPFVTLAFVYFLVLFVVIDRLKRRPR